MRYPDAVKQRALAHLEREGLAPTHLKMIELAGRDRRVLELGCATGYVSRKLTENGCSVVGIELDPEAAETARQFCERVICGDVSDPEILKQAGDGFDVIMCGDILEHLPEPERVLEKLRSFLAPGGRVLVSMPNIAYWSMRLDLLRGRFEYTETGLLDYTHLRFYTVGSFLAMVERCGYKCVSVHINDAGFPGSKYLRRIPGCRTLTDKMALWLAYKRPNLFAFHSIYTLIPLPVTETEA